MKNETKITQIEHSILNRLIFRLKIVPMIFVYEILATVFIVYGALIGEYLLMGIFCGVAIIFPFGMYFISKIRSKKTYAKYQKIYDEATYYFDFLEDGVKVELKSGKTKNNTFFKYVDLNQVVETKEHILVFINTGSAYVVTKSGFEQSYDSLGFRSIVEPNVKKYRVMKVD